MKLQAKVSLIVALTWLAICLVVYADSVFVVSKNYQILEEKILAHEVEDVKNAFNKNYESLTLYALAWSQWDDAYDFMRNKSEKFIKSNFIPATYTTAKLNFIMFFDENNKLYYGKAYDDKSGEVTPVPNELLDYLNQHPYFFKHADVESRNVGMLNTKIGLIMMTSNPIIMSNGQGPIRGSLLMGYYLTDQLFASLGQTVGYKIQFYTMDAVKRNQELSNAYKQLSSGKSYLEDLANSDVVYGFVLLNDVNQNSVGLVKVSLPRSIYQEGLSTTYHYLGIVAVLGIIVMILMWQLLRFFVLNRVVNISKQVSELTDFSQDDRAIKATGHDELTTMVSSINNMLNTIRDSQSKLQYLATHDQLTGLPNRTHFCELLGHAILKTNTTSDKLAILFLDIDKLKSVNDHYGHAVGDELIKQAAHRIRDTIAALGIVGRQSGDEFIAFLYGVKDAKSVVDVANKILEASAKPYNINDITIYISFSIGISLYPSDGSEIEGLIKCADDVMYAAKMKSGNSFEFFDHAMRFINE